MRHALLRLGLVASLSALLLAPPLRAAERSGAREAELYGNLETFATILDLVQKYYVDEVAGSEVMLGAVNGMLSALDPHSSYLTPKEFKELQEETSGRFGGVGIEVAVRDGVLTVVAPIAGTPAYLQGIKSGDQLAKINGEPVSELTLNEATSLLRGKPGEKVTLTVSRDGQQLDFTLVRALIPQHSVTAAELVPGFHYLQISTFQNATAADFKKALSEAGKKQPLKGLILDLRNNPGGLLDQAVLVADMLLEQGLIVSVKSREQERSQPFAAEPGEGKYSGPLAVLVNEGSASASEIVAGALQDHKRALIIGTKTFGKGSVQTVVPLPGEAGLRLTTARYYTPSGKSIQETGISPDLTVPFEEPEEAGRAADQIREKDLRHHLENHQQAKKPKKQKELTERRLEEDNQLRAALFILQQLPSPAPLPAAAQVLR
ncbi:MAG: S41 family peptidase [Candidatus Electronema sp. V4]|uniref:S41 family peptidase n=1 Tax=Candidatus Electronema sp. V4 TaxID=3454756 RepID=UPI0040553A9C